MIQPVAANFASAAKAYQGLPSQLAGKPATPGVSTQRASFQEFMQDSLAATRSTLVQAEATQVQGLQGKASTQEVVEAVMAAELTIQSVTAVRDRAVQAYQELLRMPI